MSIKDVRFGFNFLGDTNILTCMQSIKEWELTFACLPVSSLRLKSTSLLDSTCTVMNPKFCQTWCDCIVAKIPIPINIDSPVEKIRLENQKSFVQDISWATFLNVYSIMFELPLQGDFVNLVRLIDNQIDTYQSSAVLIQFWALVPIVNLRTHPWKKWTKFMSLIRNINQMKLVLKIGTELPSSEELDRWLGEPVTALIIEQSAFSINKKGYPILSKSHQEFIKKMFNIGCQIIISASSDIQKHVNYLNYLYRNTSSLTPYSSDFISGFEDYLQTPLQPLKQNLQSYVYETFEQDPIKYYEYEKAISKALIDKFDGKELVVFVVGAGRGPLVQATFRAAKDADIKVKVWAVEKNENALPSLLYRNKENWDNCVTIINKDMRLWKPSEKCDILVSELLGSFGDNELSPECLDGAQNYLKTDGISIPSSYTSFLSPVQSRKLHSEISSIRKNKDNCNFQKPYIVQLNNVYTIAKAKPLFTFHHPRTNLEENNSNKDGFLTFNISQDCILHGFAGYFESILYKDVKLSIVPETFSEGMFSWFPAYFPLIKPTFLRKGEELQINFWRCSTKFKVWYEWCVAKPYQSVMHNINGEMYFMSL